MVVVCSSDVVPCVCVFLMYNRSYSVMWKPKEIKVRGADAISIISGFLKCICLTGDISLRKLMV